MLGDSKLLVWVFQLLHYGVGNRRDALLLRLERGTSEMFSRIGVLLCNDYQWTQRLATPATIDSLSELHFEPERGYTVKII